MTISLMLHSILSHGLSLLLSCTKLQNFAQINWRYSADKCNTYCVVFFNFPQGEHEHFLFNIRV